MPTKLLEWRDKKTYSDTMDDEYKQWPYPLNHYRVRLEMHEKPPILETSIDARDLEHQDELAIG